MRRPFLIFSSLMCFSCGGRTTLGSLQLGPDDASSPDSSLPKADASPPSSDGGPVHVDGVILDTCSPTDAPALEVKVGGVGSCEAPVLNPGYFFAFDFWTNLPTGPGTYTPSSALQCVNAECTNATTATVTFTTFTPSGMNAAGSFSLKMPDGHTVNGTFTATQCQNPSACG